MVLSEIGGSELLPEAENSEGQEAAENPAEGKETAQLEQATFEVEEKVALTGSYQQAEAIEESVTKLVEAAPARVASPSGEGEQPGEESAVPQPIPEAALPDDRESTEQVEESPPLVPLEKAVDEVLDLDKQEEDSDDGESQGSGRSFPGPLASQAVGETIPESGETQDEIDENPERLENYMTAQSALHDEIGRLEEMLGDWDEFDFEERTIKYGVPVRQPDGQYQVTVVSGEFSRQELIQRLQKLRGVEAQLQDEIDSLTRLDDLIPLMEPFQSQQASQHDWRDTAKEGVEDPRHLDTEPLLPAETLPDCEDLLPAAPMTDTEKLLTAADLQDKMQSDGAASVLGRVLADEIKQAAPIPSTEDQRRPFPTEGLSEVIIENDEEVVEETDVPAPDADEPHQGAATSGRTG